MRSRIVGQLQDFGRPWTASQNLVSEERTRIRELEHKGLFEQESDSIVDGRFTVIGKISHRSCHGGLETLRVRLEYPSTYGQRLPFGRKMHLLSSGSTDAIAVFDHDLVYVPSSDGHLFQNHQLCLEYPWREEISRDPSLAAAETIGAATMWLLKRGIFERTSQWPGPAEKHGHVACGDLAFEEAKKAGVDLDVWARISIDSGILPQFANPCPCGSKSPLGNCHQRVGGLVALAIVLNRRS